MFEVNLVAAVSVSQAAYPYLRGRGGGLIVNIGSVADKIGMRHNLAYAASKAALGSVTRTLANEWARDGIRVLDVAPGYVVTDMNRDFFSDERNRSSIERRIPVRRLGEPEEIGALVASLFTNPIGYLTGTTIYIDGGQGAAL